MSDTLIDIAKGKVTGDRLVRVVGRRSNIASTEDDVWTGGEAATSPVAQRTLPASAGTLSIVSTDADDTAAGGGARTVLVVGLSPDWGEIRETVSLNGTTPVSTTLSFLRVNEVRVATAGSTGTNEGEIKVTHSGTGTPLQAHILGGAGVAQMASYSVPARVRAIVVRSFADASVEDVPVKLYQRSATGARQTVRDHKLGFAPLDHDHQGALVIEEMTDVWFRASVSTGTAYVAAGLDLVLTPYVSLLSFASGTFSRGTEASYLVRADAVAWDSASPTTPRLEDRGDGFGAIALFEGQRQNLLLRSEEFDSASWTKVTDTITANDVTAPDGDSNADAHGFTTAGTARAEQTFTVSDNIRVTLSVWARAAAAQTFRLGVTKKDSNTDFQASLVLTTRWARYVQAAVDILSGATTPNGRLQNHNDSVARTIFAWGAQVEPARFASSYIRTTSTAVTRNADVLIFSSGPPTAIQASAWRFDFWPYWGSADLASGDTLVLFSFGGSGSAANHLIRVRHNGTDVRAEVVTGGDIISQSAALTLTAHSRVRVDLDSKAGLVAVNGVAGAAGTPWVFPAGEMRVGGIHSATSEAFARIGEPVAS